MIDFLSLTYVYFPGNHLGRLKEKKIRVYFMYAKTFQNLMCGKRLQGRGIANKFIIDVDNQIQRKANLVFNNLFSLLNRPRV